MSIKNISASSSHVSQLNNSHPLYCWVRGSRRTRQEVKADKRNLYTPSTTPSDVTANKNNNASESDSNFTSHRHLPCTLLKSVSETVRLCHHQTRGVARPRHGLPSNVIWPIDFSSHSATTLPTCSVPDLEVSFLVLKPANSFPVQDLCPFHSLCRKQELKNHPSPNQPMNYGALLSGSSGQSRFFQALQSWSY